jgi:putative ABC transport system permease protein
MALRIKGHTFLGWVQLLHHKVRFAMALAGVAFAVMMIFMQLGFMNMLFDSTVTLHKRLNADIVLISPTARALEQPGTLPRRKLIQALGIQGVADATGFYIGSASIVKPGTVLKGQVTVLGVSPDFKAFKDDEVMELQTKLRRLGTVLFDRGSRGDYSIYYSELASGQEPVAQIGGKNAPIVGTYHLGATFGADGTIIVSDDTFRHLVKNGEPGSINVGLIQITPGSNPADVAKRISEKLGTADVSAMTMDEFITKSRDFLRKDSPIAYIFSFGVVIGLFVGTIIVVQILSTDVQDHLPEYATFKALGFSDMRLLSVVYEQSVILTVLGFLPGYLLSLALYQIVKMGVAMPIQMPLDRVLLVFALTAIMCAISGTIAMRRLRSADPAEVF